MAIDKGKAINIIIEAVHNYDFYLKNKTFMIVFKKGEEINNVEVTFRSWHFLHLTGLKSKLTAQKFYEACIDNRLSMIAVFAHTYPEKVYTETTFIARDINLSEIDLPSQVRVYKRDEAD